ncbi:major facilitator superfamily permease [Lacticaseibacillus thailandensis DSM 22698 = JCM 13996]|uniref:Major facilitator superfamily permease n=1 Tax=Lacticaseibacillus thailandensis DSM 22698 = JCM 13996 TaxID=1423810 RepID=A0A0R2CA74_9LACO|nr:major facilitator superfamily permease [Lacticaseibacillus thailandensis DSM 22698 = JCM 13996]
MINTVADKIRPRVIGAIVATGLMSFCGVIVETAMNITFPTLMREFNITTNEVQWLTTLYLLVVASMVPLSATLKRRFRTRSLFLVAITLFIIGIILDGIAPSFAVLLLGRGIQGLGTGVALPLMFNIILEQVPRSKVGTMMGVGTLITGVAPAIGPTFGGLIVSTLNWRYIFAILLPLLIFALILGLFCIEQKQAPEPANIDAPSVVTIVITFCGLIYGLSNIGNVAFASWPVAGVMAVGVIALLVFVWRSHQLEHPLIRLGLFKQPLFTISLLSFACLQIIALALSFVLPNYIQLVNGNTALLAGLVVLPGAAIGAIMAPIGGRLLDHNGPKLPLRLGSIISLVGVGGMLLSATGLTNSRIVVLYILVMIGIGISMGNLMTTGLQQIASTTQTDGNAIFNTAQQFTAAVGTSMASALVAAGQSSAHNLAHGTVLGTTHALLAVVIIALVEILLVWLLTARVRRHQ